MTEEFLIDLGGLFWLLVLIVIGVPIAYAMILVALIGIMLQSGPTIILNQLEDLAYGQFSNYDVSVLPMFILMGGLAARCGLSRDIFCGANAWLGRFRGGVAMAAIAACAGFGAVCGSFTATASTMGKVAIPELRKYKYSGALATGCTAAGGTLGILIPPSIVLIVYAIIVEVNIINMFAAALISGILATLMFIGTIGLYVRFAPGSGPKARPVTARELRQASLAMLPMLIIFGVVIGGIYAGIYSLTAAVSIGVVMSLIYGAVRRRLRISDTVEALLETARTSAMIFLIVFGAELLKIFMSRTSVQQAAADLLQDSGLALMTIMVVIIATLLILGCLMDSLSMVILAIPFFWPVVAGLDFGLSADETKLWFGIVILVVVKLGPITPVGLNVFVINSAAPNVPMRETFKGVMPFLRPRSRASHCWPCFGASPSFFRVYCHKGQRYEF